MALQTTLSIDDLADILEMVAVHQTWTQASEDNARLRAKEEAGG